MMKKGQHFSLVVMQNLLNFKYKSNKNYEFSSAKN
jgi:hypothetical protein